MHGMLDDFNAPKLYPKGCTANSTRVMKSYISDLHTHDALTMPYVLSAEYLLTHRIIIPSEIHGILGHSASATMVHEAKVLKFCIKF